MSMAALSRRSLLQAGGALVVGFGFAGRSLAQVIPGADAALGKTVDGAKVDGFLAFHADGSVTLYSGKVDLGTGHRIAVRQMAAEELGIGVDRIKLIEGDSALTPDQGTTAGSTGISRGGTQVRQAAATARAALLKLGAEKLGKPEGELTIVDGNVVPKAGGAGVAIASLIGDRKLQLKLDPKAPLKDPKDYTVVGQPLPRPDVPAKVAGTHVYVHDFKVPGMLHARVIRPAAVGATLEAVDADSIKGLAGIEIVRIKDFLAVVGDDEWTTIKAARQLKTKWTQPDALLGDDQVLNWMRTGPFTGDDALVKKGDAGPVLASATTKLAATYYWPMQSHASMGPSCAVADVKADSATVWTASQGPHRLRQICARILKLDPAKVRVVYLDGAGCYGMNGHDDASADAALISQKLGRPVRVQWSREDEHGWDPKGPPQLLSLEGALGPDGKISAWRTEMWVPKATAGLPNIPLLGPEAAGLAQQQGLSTGMITQNGDPPYAVPNVEVTIHWLKDAPLRPSNIRAPGKIANSFAVESFFDELATRAGKDAVQMRLDGLADPRGIEVIKRTASLIGWENRPKTPGGGRGIGFSYVHYKHNETYVGIAMDVEVDKRSGEIRVHRIACAHDCGLVINPDTVKQQVEGNILQTLSRALHEEVTFDKAKVTSLDWASYPILTFPDVPDVKIELVMRQDQPPLGAGEAAAAPVGGALANGVFAAAGVRLRTVPFTPERVKEALARGGA
jgi:nicotinate dehydrogenase subunit B